MSKELYKSEDGILFTDQYQLTMAQLYFTMGIHEKEAQFDHFFRSYPDYGLHKAGYCINAGLETLVDWVVESSFGDGEIKYLRSQTGSTGERIFKDDFLAWLKGNGNFREITLYSIPEGRVVHPNTPLTVIRGPLAMGQILESALLNKLNYQTLIATKAMRIKEAARGNSILEFGMRRGQDSGVNAGVRAALIGGADFSSCVSISRALGYAPKGTHAHSMVQAFMALGGGELSAFRAYAELYPDDCLLLVDTFNTLESGIPNAVTVFNELRAKGHEPIGIRLDSGDLAFLSIQAAKMLNEAGFPDTKIVLSNQLDELVIWQIITQVEEEAPRYGLDPEKLIDRLVYGVGTRLITSEGCSALDGVYKLVSVKDGAGWAPAIKLSETPLKTLNPGNKQVFRIYDKRGRATADLLTVDEPSPEGSKEIILRHPIDHSKHRALAQDQVSAVEPLLVKILDKGELVYDFPSIEEIREVRSRDMDRLDLGVKRIMNPHIYHVSVSQKLWDLKQDLISSVNGDG